MSVIKHETEPFALPIEATVRIRPEVEIDTIAYAGTTDQVAHLRFYVECGKDSWGTFTAEGFWQGPREGSDWERFKAHWQSQLDYISTYLGGTVHRAALQLCHETEVLHMHENPEWGQVLAEYSDDLKAFDRHGGNSSVEIEALRATIPTMPIFQWIVGWWAYSIRARLTNTATLKIGSNDMLRFSNDMVMTYQAIFPELCTLWQAVKQVIRTNRVHWKSVIAERFASADIPTDLLDVAAENQEYRPAQLARVHAARVAGFTAHSTVDRKLTIAQERTIRREVKQYLAGLRGHVSQNLSPWYEDTD